MPTSGPRCSIHEYISTGALKHAQIHQHTRIRNSLDKRVSEAGSEGPIYFCDLRCIKDVAEVRLPAFEERMTNVSQS